MEIKTFGFIYIYVASVWVGLILNVVCMRVICPHLICAHHHVAELYDQRKVFVHVNVSWSRSKCKASAADSEWIILLQNKIPFEASWIAHAKYYNIRLIWYQSFVYEFWSQAQPRSTHVSVLCEAAAFMEYYGVDIYLDWTLKYIY